MNFGEHVELGEWNGQVLLTVHDYELLDFIEDHFVGLGVETRQVHPQGSAACYQLLFGAGISKTIVWQALEVIGKEQISCIVAINSGAGSEDRDV